LSLFPNNRHRIERALLKSAVAGDSRASKELIRLFSSPAYSLAWKMLGNKEDAEDVVQEAFIRLWRSADSFSGRSGLFTYFYAIVSNLCLDRLKSLNKIVLEEFDESGCHLEQDLDWSAEEEIGSDEIKKAMDVLSVKQRMAILMWAYQDMTAEEVGLAMGMNKNSVDQLLYRAKLKLKSELEKGAIHEIN
jgi:RNA polymerase sigma-70 factor, ECF subfamily